MKMKALKSLLLVLVVHLVFIGIFALLSASASAQTWYPDMNNRMPPATTTCLPSPDGSCMGSSFITITPRGAMCGANYNNGERLILCMGNNPAISCPVGYERGIFSYADHVNHYTCVKQ